MSRRQRQRSTIGHKVAPYLKELRLFTDLSRGTIGEVCFALALSAFAAALAAVAGFVGAIFFCAKLLSGEAREAALILAPATAAGLAVVAFFFCFRKIISHGEVS